ncbi:MAG: hypothetical protein AAGA39_03430 [Pseudomonadota bacterium]
MPVGFSMGVRLRLRAKDNQQMPSNRNDHAESAEDALDKRLRDALDDRLNEAPKDRLKDRLRAAKSSKPSQVPSKDA